MLKRTEEQRALKLEHLRAAVATGTEALGRGEFTEVASDEELDSFFDQI